MLIEGSVLRALAPIIEARCKLKGLMPIKSLLRGFIFLSVQINPSCVNELNRAYYEIISPIGRFCGYKAGMTGDQSSKSPNYEGLRYSKATCYTILVSKAKIGTNK